MGRHGKGGGGSSGSSGGGGSSRAPPPQGEGLHDIEISYDVWTLTYTVGWSAFHIGLLYWYASPFVLCPGATPDDADACWRLESWVQFTWILQLFYYTLSFVGHWVPELQRQATLAMATMVHGLVWLNLVFALSGDRTPNALAALRDGYPRSFAHLGTWTTMVLPVPLYYMHLWMKRTFHVLVLEDAVSPFTSVGSVIPSKWRAFYASITYHTLSPLVAVGLWHLWLKPAGHCVGRTDWPEWSILGLILVVLWMALVNSIGLFLFRGLQRTIFVTVPYWVDYYRRGILLGVDRRSRTIVFTLVDMSLPH